MIDGDVTLMLDGSWDDERKPAWPESHAPRLLVETESDDQFRVVGFFVSVDEAAAFWFRVCEAAPLVDPDREATTAQLARIERTLNRLTDGLPGVPDRRLPDGLEVSERRENCNADCAEHGSHPTGPFCTTRERAAVELPAADRGLESVADILARGDHPGAPCALHHVVACTRCWS